MQPASSQVRLALASGITHVDFHPGKERDGVARVIASRPEGRDGLFLNTKVRKLSTYIFPRTKYTLCFFLT